MTRAARIHHTHITNGYIKMDIEQWKQIDGFPGYEVSSHGNVRSWLSGSSEPLVLKTRLSNGYPHLNLSFDGHKKTVSVHRLVARAFHGDPPTSGHQVAHNDGNRTNNHATNLRWATPKENTQDKLAHGTAAIGTCQMARLSDSDIEEIKTLHRNHRMTKADIARKFGITRHAVYALTASA